MKSKLSLLVLFFGILSSVQAQEFELFDLNPGGDSSPRDFLILGDYMFFTASDESHGREIWRTDGTSLGTELLVDLNVGIESSFPRELTLFEDKFVFSAFTEETGHEIFVSDGTAAGTQILRDLNPGTPDAHPRDFVVYNDKLYFIAANGSGEDVLWSSEGTLITTSQFYDFDIVSAYLEHLGATDDYLFIGFEGINAQLWSTNGTIAGTQFLSIARFNFSNPYTIFQNKYYFSQYDLSVSDGTPGGTYSLEHDSIGYHTYSHAEMNDKLYFSLLGDPRGIWFTDGDTTQLEFLLNPDPGGVSDSYPLLGDNNLLYFAASNGVDGLELWTTNADGSFVSMITNNVGGSSAPRILKKYRNEVYFKAFSGTEGYELWKTDGTSSGTSKLSPSFGGLDEPLKNTAEFFEFSGALFFAARYTSAGLELWKYTDTTQITSVNEIRGIDQVQLYPNPCKDYMTLRFELDRAENMLVEINNILGQTVYTKQIQAQGKIEERLAMENLTPGTYFLNLRNKSSHLLKSKKFVKQ